MAERPTDVTLDTLIKIQESIGSLRSELGDFRLASDAKFERIETIMQKQRRDSAGMLVMMRATVTDFDERVSELEERVTALETAGTI